MKSSTRSILKSFPMLESYISHDDTLGFTADDIVKLNDVEQTFLKLAWYYEDPDTREFNLQDMYKHLSDDWLAFALETMMFFFQENTYLLKDSTFTIVTDDDDYYNQTQFAAYLNEHGEKFDNAKMSTYVKRGVIPKPSLILSGTKYWEKDICEFFLKARLTPND